MAKWSVVMRATGVSDATLDQALADGTLVRTHVLRPTWHTVAAADIRWMLALTAPRVHATSASYYRQHGLDDAVFAKAHALLASVLKGGNQLTRKEVAAVFEDGGVARDNMVIGFLLLHAELEQVICSGALTGKQRTYALFDERVPPAPTRDRDEALAAGDPVETVIDGQTYWHAASPPPGRPEPSPTAHLLQAYDEYTVAYAGRRKAFDLAGLASERTPFLHTIVLDGQYAGSWRRTLKRTEVAIEVRPARPFGPVEREAVAAAADRYARFVDLPATLAIED